MACLYIFGCTHVINIGFTKLSSSLKSSEVVSLLHQLYEYYDSFAKECEVEKIETIGDAYICVVFDGSTDKILQFALKVVDTHLDMQNFIIEDTYSNCDFKAKRNRKLTWHAVFENRARSRQTNSSLNFTTQSQQHGKTTNKTTLDGKPIRDINVRIGIATGECHGCVVGKSGLRFHLFGPALDQAIHLEEIAKQQQILVCQETKARSKNRFIKFIPHATEPGAYWVEDTIRSTVGHLAQSWANKGRQRHCSTLPYGNATVFVTDDDDTF